MSRDVIGHGGRPVMGLVERVTGRVVIGDEENGRGGAGKRSRGDEGRRATTRRWRRRGAVEGEFDARDVDIVLARVVVRVDADREDGDARGGDGGGGDGGGGARAVDG